MLCYELCNVLERLGHFNGIVPSLACILTKQYGVYGGKYLLKTSGNAISETTIFKMSLDASALKNLCLWCEFQSRLLFILSLLLKNFLTALDIWHKYHSGYFKILPNFTSRQASEITYNNFEISLVVFMPNITTNHAITYTYSLARNSLLSSNRETDVPNQSCRKFCCVWGNARFRFPFGN